MSGSFAGAFLDFTGHVFGLPPHDLQDRGAKLIV
jgi:hypothetical protein